MPCLIRRRSPSLSVRWCHSENRKTAAQPSVNNDFFPGRIARVEKIDVVNVSLSGIVQLGDHCEFTPTLKALAVQRAISHEQAGDVYFESYAIFTRPLPELPCGNQDVHMSRCNVRPDITVGSIHILGVGSAALLQAGNGCLVRAESRIKHIRQYASSASPDSTASSVFPPSTT
ncbi:spore germination protein GerPE [Paenibacillaceae bacterium]|nr:spore germination protein GerPE [Paenibacillaceae bacterium]